MVYSHTPGSPLLEEDTILSITSGVRGQVRNKALDLHILPAREVPTFISARYVPWVNWTRLSNTSEGVGDFLGSFYSYDTDSFQVVNNTDSILYITGGIPERGSIIAGPEVIIGPYKSSNITLSSSSVTVLARCYGYDFTTTRSIRGFLDTRGPSAYVELKGLRQGDNPTLPILRSSWLRFYDMFDLISYSNPLPVNQITNTSWNSLPLDLSGAVGAYLNVVATSNHVPTAGSELLGFLSYSGIATGQGNWASGNTSLITVVGNNYITNASLVLSGNKPQVEFLFLPGDMTGTVVNYLDLWVAAEVTP